MIDRDHFAEYLKQDGHWQLKNRRAKLPNAMADFAPSFTCRLGWEMKSCHADRYTGHF